jgi:hypothetical protein
MTLGRTHSARRRRHEESRVRDEEILAILAEAKAGKTSEVVKKQAFNRRAASHEGYDARLPCGRAREPAWASRANVSRARDGLLPSSVAARASPGVGGRRRSTAESTRVDNSGTSLLSVGRLAQEWDKSALWPIWRAAKLLLELVELTGIEPVTS